MSMFGSRYGPWALVAGASEGLGAEFAREIARRGVNVILVARRREALARTAGAIAGVEVRTLVLDLAAANAAGAVAQAVRDVEVGLLVYNAAFSPIGPFLDRPVEDHMRTIQVDCTAMMCLVHEIGRTMRQRGRGGILVMSSMAGLQGTALVGNYAATKAYARVLAEGLWEELRGHGVDVLACCAGPTGTPGYLGSLPERPGFRPPVLDPATVASEALDGLGRGPVMVPGLTNRLAALFIDHLLSTRGAVRIMGRTMRSIYGAPASAPHRA